KSIPFAEGFKTKFGNYPSYAGYTAYDEVYFIADAVKRGGSTDADKLVEALEKTDWVGTIGRVEFYGKDDPFTHSIKYGKGLITGLMLQWQDGAQVAVWPPEVAQAKLKFPSFIKGTTNLALRLLRGTRRELFSWRDFLFPRGGGRGCRGEINACV